MSITFYCGHCGRMLTTAEDRAGQQAKCPGCGEAVTVPPPAAPLALEEEAFPARDGGESSQAAEAAAPPKPRSTRTCPMCGMENPRKVQKCQACGEEFPGEEGSARGVKQSLDVGTALSNTWDIFKDHLAVTVGGTLIYMIPALLWIYSLIVAVVVSVIYLDQQHEELLVALLIAGPISLLSFCLLIYMSPGYSLLILGVARGEAVGLGTLFRGGKFLIRSFLVSIIFSTCALFGFALCIVPGVLITLMWWAYSLVLVDEDSPGISCLARSKELMQGQWGQVFLTLLVGSLINNAAASFCIILGIFSQAYFSLLMAIVYLRISGQLTALERPPAQEDKNGIDE